MQDIIVLENKQPKRLKVKFSKQEEKGKDFSAR